MTDISQRVPILRPGQTSIEGRTEVSPPFRAAVMIPCNLKDTKP